MADIGIITRHCYPNYGALLQAYALAAAVKRVGHRPRVIDYVPRSDEPSNLVASRLRASRMGSNVATRAAFRLVEGRGLARAARTFRSHQERLLPLTTKFSDTSQIAHVTEGMGAVFAGSDQLWNRVHGSLDPTYFLDPVKSAKTRKLSYAASLGNARPNPDDADAVARMLASFESISVREASSLSWLSEVGLEGRADVDPVLLHDRGFWSQFALAGSPADAAPSTLVYQVHFGTPGVTRVAKHAQRHFGTLLSRVTADQKQVLLPGRRSYLASPEAFVRAFADAQCVVTDSFHGAVFSVVFGTPFLAVLPSAGSTRIVDFLDSVGLDRNIVRGEDVDVSQAVYDPEVVWRKLNGLRADSWKYLRDATAGS